jgi:hypothetical protein
MVFYNYIQKHEYIKNKKNENSLLKFLFTVQTKTAGSFHALA